MYKPGYHSKACRMQHVIEVIANQLAQLQRTQWGKKKRIKGPKVENQEHTVQSGTKRLLHNVW